MNPVQYKALVQKTSKNSPILKNCICAFLVGGAICTVGQGISDLCKMCPALTEESSKMWTSVILIFLSALFTGVGLYDKLAKFGGAGTLVPITGFANAMVSPALEFKSEGMVLGTGVKLFSIAGPVIVYGTAASAVYGLIYFIVKTFV